VTTEFHRCERCGQTEERLPPLWWAWGPPPQLEVCLCCQTSAQFMKVLSGVGQDLRDAIDRSFPKVLHALEQRELALRSAAAMGPPIGSVCTPCPRPSRCSSWTGCTPSKERRT